MIENFDFRGIDFPKGMSIYLSCRLKGLGNSYTSISKNIISNVQKHYVPETIIIPTYTLNWPHDKVFDVASTPSNVGRFSEEIRKVYPSDFRTPNPMYSVVDTQKKFKKVEIDHLSAFGPNSIFDVLSNNNYVMMNINLELPHFTQFHHMEELWGVSYRDYIHINGKLNDGHSTQDVDYEFFARKLDQDNALRRRKITNDLLSSGALMRLNCEGVIIHWGFSDNVYEVFREQLLKDEFWFISD